SVVDQLFLARLLIHPAGFASNPAFQDAFGAPVIDTSHVFYDGNSQGGILGGLVMEFAQEITRGVLGVPAITFSTLVTRSSYFATPAMPSFPFDGSALVVWDHGCSTPASCPNPPAVADCTCPPPTTNTPPPGGHDPHEDPRSQPSARTQKSEFLQANGVV